MKTGLISKLIKMKTNIILSVIAFTLITGYKATAQTLGNACGSTSNPLTMDWEIPLDGYTFNFSEQATTPSQVRIGYPNCTPSTVARLNVLNDILQAAGYFQTSVNTSTVSLGTASFAENTGGDAIGIYAEAVSNSSISHAIGINANSVNGTNAALKHTAVDAHAANGTWQSFAVNGDVKNSMSDENYGYQTEIYNAKSTAYNYGFHGWVNTPGTANYGMLIDVSGATNNYGLYVTALPAATPPSFGSNYAAYMNGDVYINGSAFATSDKNLKENITSFAGANQLLNTLNPVTFDYKQTGEYEKLHLPTEHQYGLIAQEVENVLPTFVKDIVSPTEYDTLGNETRASMKFKAVNYNGLIPILVQGHREQSGQIDSIKNSNKELQVINHELQSQVKSLNDRLTQLENCLSGVLPHLCQMSHNGIQQNTSQTQELIRQQLSVYLSDKTAIILDQNVPNPFAEQTIISFSVPETVKQAQILFYNGRGELIKTVDVRERGLGSITVYGADLSSGTYMYTLIADGMIVATKKMIKQ